MTFDDGVLTLLVCVNAFSLESTNSKYLMILKEKARESIMIIYK